MRSYDQPAHCPHLSVSWLCFRNHLKLNEMTRSPDLRRWESLAKSVDEVTQEVKIAIVGKYTGLSDSYLSVLKVCSDVSSAHGISPSMIGNDG